jgi:hypothetical protein
LRFSVFGLPFTSLLLTISLGATSLATATSSGTDSGPNFSTGFAQANGLSLNNGAAINGSRLRLTDGGNYEARSVFATTPVQLQSFTNDFSFQLTNANADGFTFTIATSRSALGSNGGGLGYGGINNSVAVKFDLYNNSGEGNNSTQDPFRD